MKTRVERLAASWSKSTSHPARYEPLRGTNLFAFTYSDDYKQRLREEKEWEAIEDELKEMHYAANDLARYLSTCYLELDLVEKEEAAWKAYVRRADPTQ